MIQPQDVQVGGVDFYDNAQSHDDPNMAWCILNEMCRGSQLGNRGFWSEGGIDVFHPLLPRLSFQLDCCGFVFSKSQDNI